jgi:hypothetical protein
MIAIFPEIASLAASKDYEALACAVRSYFAGPQAKMPKMDLIDVCQSIGIEINQGPSVELASLLAIDENGQFNVKIHWNPIDLTSNDRSLLLAHMLGHFFLHCQLEIARGASAHIGFTEQHLPTQRCDRSLYDSVEEQMKFDLEADRFALSLLMPKGMLRKAAEHLKTTANLSRFFGVPEEAVAYRLEYINANSHLNIGSQRNNAVPVKRDALVKDPSNDSTKPNVQGIRRLREIARSMDSSVKV